MTNPFGCDSLTNGRSNTKKNTSPWDQPYRQRKDVDGDLGVCYNREEPEITYINNQQGINRMKRKDDFQVSNKNFCYMRLSGKTVAVRTMVKIQEKEHTWFDTVDYERQYIIAKVDEVGSGSFIDPENNEYALGDIIKVF